MTGDMDPRNAVRAVIASADLDLADLSISGEEIAARLAAKAASIAGTAPAAPSPDAVEAAARVRGLAADPIPPGLSIAERAAWYAERLGALEWHAETLAAEIERLAGAASPAYVAPAKPAHPRNIQVGDIMRASCGALGGPAAEKEVTVAWVSQNGHRIRTTEGESYQVPDLIATGRTARPVPGGAPEIGGAS